jgi:hypothetical protein
MMTTFQERFEEVDDGVDPEEFVAALEYARDDGRRRRRR